MKCSTASTITASLTQHLPPPILTSDFQKLIQHKPGQQKVYYYDSYEYTRYFSDHLFWNFAPGDAPAPRKLPTVAKCRLIDDMSKNMILLNLDKVRHFIFLDDNTDWDAKSPTAIYRGRMGRNPSRRALMETYLHNERIDVGDVSRPGMVPNEWIKPKISLYKHLTHRFILCPEGNDVASNLKWVMSTNTVAVMPEPKWETWFMEGRLVDGQHYIKVKPDFSNLEEKIDYYLEHPNLAHEIISEAHKHINLFKDKHKEKLISLMVLEKYFRCTGQTPL